MAGAMKSLEASVSKLRTRRPLQALIEMFCHIFRAVTDQRAEFHVWAALFQEAIPPDACNAALDYTGIFVFGEKCF